MKKIYLVHCWDGTCNDGWYPWIDKELKKYNVSVIRFDMPNTTHPKIEEWVCALEKQVTDIDEETYFIGHSIGCQTILRYLEKNYKSKIGGILFVAPWLELLPEAVSDEDSFNTALPWLSIPINFDRVKSTTSNINCIFSSNDYFVPSSQVDVFKDKLSSSNLIVKGKGHISQDDGVDKLPEILEVSLKMLNIDERV